MFRYSHRVTYAECTAGNHIYYGRYPELLEAARGEFFRHAGPSFLYWQQQDAIFPVIECRLRYKAPARYDALLSVEVWVMTAEGARLDFGYRILDESGSVLVEAETRHVCTGLNEKPKRLPAGLRDSLEPHLRRREKFGNQAETERL